MNREKRLPRSFTGFLLKTRYIWVSLTTMQLVAGTALWGGEITSEPILLRTIRAGRHSSYSTVVFEFDDQSQFEKPVFHGDEVRFRLKNVKTTLVPYREHNISESWVKLEKADDDLNVEVGLLKGFVKFTYLVLTNPDRLVFKLHRDESENVSPSEEKATDSEDAEPAVAKERLMEDVPQGTATSSPKATPPKRNRNPTQPAGSESIAPRIEQKKGVIQQSLEQELLTLNFYQADIREILSALAMQQKKNIVTSRDVTGEVSVHLYRVPFQRALEAICRAGGFSHHKLSEVYYVFKPRQAQEPGAERLKMRIFQLEYADVDKIQVDTDAAKIGKTFPVKLGIVGDAASVVKALRELVPAGEMDPEFKEMVRSARAEHDALMAADAIYNLSPAGQIFSHQFWKSFDFSL